MQERSRIFLSRDRTADLSLAALAATVTLVVLQAYRVFVPYLVFEIDQSERTTLATIAVIVFGLTFCGALLFRLLGPRGTLALAAVVLIAGRLCIQFSSDPGIRWKLGAATVVAGFWLLIVLLPQGGRSVGIGVGVAFLIDLMMRALRGTLDLPWMPGLAAHLATILIVTVLALAAYACAQSGRITNSEASLMPTFRFIGLGSGLALWLVAAGNPGFAEVRSEFDLSGAFALLASGTLAAIWFESTALTGWHGGSDGRAIALALGCLGALAMGAWIYGDSRWLDLAMTPVLAFTVTMLTMRSATSSGQSTVSGRWRCGAALTVGMLLQTGFVFLYFARSAPMGLLLIPLVILTVATLAREESVPLPLPTPRRVKIGFSAAVMAVVIVTLVLAGETDSPAEARDLSGLRVMTFNIQEGFSNENIWSLEETARTIEEHDPDIVVLQEITRGWLVMSSVDEVRWLADRVEMDFAYSGNSHDGLWGNAILSRLPIVSTDAVVYSTTDNLRRGAVAVEVQTDTGNLVVIDTHLDNPRGSVDVRLEQITELLGFWDGITPAIIAGDFNADPGSPEWQTLSDAGFIDSGEGSSETTSEDERRIDYIWITPNLQVDSYTVPVVWVSDHRPVVADLSLVP
jgi:endonuclease/exonuclease/phosphatase family metal-dependent hydrolase